MKKEEFLIEEYKILWNYYKETINNRKNLFDWYFKIIAIPATIFGIAAGSNVTNLKWKFDEILIGLILLVIAMSGIGVFIGYVLECKNSKRYLKEIERIKSHLKGNKLSDVITLNVSKGPLLNQWRATPIILINSFLLSIGLFIIFELLDKSGALYTFFLAVMTHIIFDYLYT